MMPVPPSDTHDRGQRESREVPIDNHPMNRWCRAGAGLINSADVDWRGYPAATPDEVPQIGAEAAVEVDGAEEALQTLHGEALAPSRGSLGPVGGDMGRCGEIWGDRA